MKGFGKQIGKISLGMLAIPAVLGGIGINIFLKWNPFDKNGTSPARNDKEKLENEIMEFRNDWTKNKTKYLEKMKIESKECIDNINKNTYELPEPIQKMIDIIDEKVES